MWYNLAADLIVAIHILYIMVVVVGLGLILIGLRRKWNWIRKPWFRVSHLVAILIVVFEVVFDRNCPLSVWDSQLRSLAGQSGSETTFIDRLLWFILFADAPSVVI